MKVYSIIAIVLCVVAASSAQTYGPLQTLACDKALAQLQNMQNTVTIPALKDKITQAIEQLNQICFSRGVFDSLANVLNLGSVWNIISSLQTTASSLFGQFTEVLEKIVFSGKFLWDNHIKDLLAQLVADLKAHALDAAPIVSSYIPKLLAVLAQAGKREIPDALQRGIWDTVSSFFNLDGIWANITNVASDYKQQLISLLTQLMFMGTQAFNQAKVILAQLASDLLTHGTNATPLVQSAIQQLKDLVAQAAIGAIASGKRDLENTRGFWDNVANIFGLNTVWSTITSTAGDIKNKFFLVLEKLLFAGSQAWANAVPIFKQLVADLTAHAGNAAPLLSAAVDQLTALLPSGKRALAEERGILEFAENLFGISGIIQTVTALGSNIKDQFLNVVKQVFFAGTQAWANAKPIFTQLVSDIVSHAGNAKPLVTDAIAQLQAVVAGAVGKREVAVERGLVDFVENFFGLSGIVSTINGLTSQLKEKFFAIIEQVFFAGSQAWANAKPIFGELVANLQGHANQAVPLITTAINQLTTMLSNVAGKRELAVERGILDFIENMFGISGIIQTVTALGSSIKDKFLDVVKQVFFAGTQAWSAAMPIFSQLVSDLQSHAGNALPFVNGAIAQLKDMLVQIAAQHVGKRGLFDGLVQQWTAITQQIPIILGAVHGQLKEKLFAVLLQVSTLAAQGKEAATTIIKQLVADLKAHGENAIPLVQAAIQQLMALLPQQGKRDLARLSILDTVISAFNNFFPNVEFGNLGNEVVALINHVSGPLKDQLLSVLAQVLFSVAPLKDQAVQLIVNAFNQLKNDWTKAPTVILKLVADIKNLLGL
jgi:glycerol-3-phosphate responsive antiterminator